MGIFDSLQKTKTRKRLYNFDLQEIYNEDLYKNLCIARQSPFLFYDTLYNNIILEEKDIIGIYNIESMRDSEEYKNLIESLKRTDNLVLQANGDARSLIMTKENGKIVGYETNVSTMSIAKRAEDNKNRKGTLLGGFYNGKI